MGTWNSVYIGPYVMVKSRSKETKSVEKYHPDTGQIFKDDNIKFCPTTGKELLKREKVSKTSESLTWFESENLDEDMFFAPPYPEYKDKNIHILNGELNTFCESDCFNYDMSNLDIQSRIFEFKAKYKPYLDYLTEENWEYSIHYGVVHYAS